MAAEDKHDRPSRSRLDAARERVLLDVALDQLAEVGYDRLSLDEVARRAHTSKATLYRRWPCKAAMIAAAFLSRKRAAVKPAPAATLRDDLLAELAFLCRETAASGPLLQGLITAICTDPRLGSMISLQKADALQQDIASIIARAVERGDLAPRAAEKTATVAEVIYALLASRFLLSRAPLDAAFIEQQVDTVLLPILRAV